MTPKSFVAAILALALPAFCSAASYTVTDLGTLGGTTSFGYGINASGQVVGTAYTTGDVGYHAFIYDGTMHDLDPLGVTNSSGLGINASGQVTGAAYTSGGSFPHAFLYDGTMHDINGVGQTDSVGRGINASGEVVGWFDPAVTGAVTHAFLYDGTMHDLGSLAGPTYAMGINDSGQATGFSDAASLAFPHAFLYTPGQPMADLGTIDGTIGNSFGHGINASGQVVGNSTLSGFAAGNSTFHAFLYDGMMHDLYTLGGTNSSAMGINASGQVVGNSDVTGGDTHAFLFDAIRGMVDLNSLINPSSGWVLNSAQAINDSGQITGYGTIDGQTHAFLFTPIPEPSSIVLAALGLVGLAPYGWLRSCALGAGQRRC